MINLKVITMSGVETLIVPADKPICEILDEEDLTYAGRTLTLNGYALSASELGMTLEEMHVGDKATIGITAKTENAATATVIGNALVVTSALKREDLEQVIKYRPKAMTLYEMDEDEKKKPVFAVALTKRNAGEIGKNGAVFGEVTDAEGHARLTMTFEADKEKQDLIDEIGPAILKLNKLEGILAQQLTEIAADKEAATGAIIFA